MSYAFNQLSGPSNPHEAGTEAWARREAELLTASGRHTVAREFPEGSGNWNVIDADKASAMAAGLAVDEAQSFSGGAEAQGFLGFIGTSVSYQRGIDSGGRSCSIVQWCVQFGAGALYGVGPTSSVTAADLSPGRSSSWGIFGAKGFGAIGGGSIDFSQPGMQLDLNTKIGKGAAAGVQWCERGISC